MKPDQQFSATRVSRRRLFGLGAATVGLSTLLAACGKDAKPAAGRIGYAPTPTDFSDQVVDDAVYLRTLTSLSHSIIEVYGVLAAVEGLDSGVAALLARFTADHTADGATFAGLTTDAGGEPYECSNAWLMRRAYQPVLDHVIGGGSIAPTDDADRDALAIAYALETTAAASGQLYLTRLTVAPARGAVLAAATQASRRAAAAALAANPAPAGYVSTRILTGEEVAPVDGFVPVFAIPARFGALTPVEIRVGAPDDLDQRYKASFETPADNAFVYAGQACAS